MILPELRVKAPLNIVHASCDSSSFDCISTNNSLSSSLLKINLLNKPNLKQFSSASKFEMSSKSFLSKLGQNFNLSGIVSFFQLLSGERHLTIPHLTVKDINEVDWNALRKVGFCGVVFDKDNTLTLTYMDKISPRVYSSFQECNRVFNGNVAILSNSAGLYEYDPNGEEAASLEASIGIKVIRHKQKKPSGSKQELENHFGFEAHKLIMVGDRYFTDVLYGNRNGLFTIYTHPLSSENEKFVIKQVRYVEDRILQNWTSNGLQFPSHPLASFKHQFLKNNQN